MSYPVMVDPSKIMAMELLAQLYELVAFAGEHTKLPIFVSKMIQITLKHGMSPLSPLAFVQYGNYNVIIRRNYEVGYHYVKLGLALMKQSPSRAKDCQIIFHSAYTRLHLEPMQTAGELFLDAFKAAMKSGATRYAMKCAYFYDVTCFWSGANLEELARSMKETIKQMKFHKNLLMMSFFLQNVRMVLRMVGESAVPPQMDIISAFGDTHNEADLIDKIPGAMLAKHFNEFYEAYIFREFDKATDCADKFFSLHNLTKFSGSPMYHRIL
eukprot:scaffold10103_cov103-Skeletonema_dohrnii-CCMP3373.AAC.1